MSEVQSHSVTDNIREIKSKTYKELVEDETKEEAKLKM